MKPINLTDDEVQKLKRGELTEIVREVRPQPVLIEYPGYKRDRLIMVEFGGSQWLWNSQTDHPAHFSKACPYAKPNKIRWVREAYWTHEADKLLVYRADGEMSHNMSGTKWRSAFQMPQWASRFLLKVTTVNVEKRGKWVWIMKVEEDKGV